MGRLKKGGSREMRGQGFQAHAEHVWAALLYDQAVSEVNSSNCLIKKVLEMDIVASNKKVLEIKETYLL